MKKICFFALVLCLFTLGCAKPDEPTEANDPVFMVTYGLNPATTITAGQDSVYLFTRYDVANRIFHSVSTFSKVACPTGECPGSLTFEFRDSINADSAFFVGQYSYAGVDTLAVPSSYSIQFFWGDNTQFSEQTITINDSVSYSTPQQTVTLPLPITPQLVFLNGYNSSGMESYTQRLFLPGSPDEFPAISIQAIPDGNTYRLRAESFGVPIKTYSWNTLTQDTIPIIVVDSTNILPNYTVTATDYSGRTAIAGLTNLPFPPTEAINTAIFDYLETPIFNQNLLGDVTIQWVDAAGQIWRSDRQPQPPFANFTVLEYGLYEPNENGDSTRKLKIRFNCLLFTDGGESREFSGEGVVAMARP